MLPKSVCEHFFMQVEFFFYDDLGPMKNQMKFDVVAYLRVLGFDKCWILLQLSAKKKNY